MCVYDLVKDWQSMIVGIIAIFIGWRTLRQAIQAFELNALVAAILPKHPTIPD